MKEFKDILFDYDKHTIGHDAGITFVSKGKITDVHIVIGGDCFSKSCCPVVGEEVLEAGENYMPGVL